LHSILEETTAKNRFDWTAYRSKRERQPRQNRDSTIESADYDLLSPALRADKTKGQGSPQ
jgi:hypothetical protein